MKPNIIEYLSEDYYTYMKYGTRKMKLWLYINQKNGCPEWEEERIGQKEIPRNFPGLKERLYISNR